MIATAALVLACAMCPDDTASDPPLPAPRVVAVHDDDPARGLRGCWALVDETGAALCAVLPARPGLDAGEVLVFTIYTDVPQVGEAALGAVDQAQAGAARGLVAPEVEAPPAPYAKPAPTGVLHATDWKD